MDTVWSQASVESVLAPASPFAGGGGGAEIAISFVVSH